MLLLEKSIGQSSFAHTWIHARLDDEMQSGREVRSSPTLTHMCDACRTSRATTAVGREMMTDSRPAETNSAQSLNDSHYSFFFVFVFFDSRLSSSSFLPFHAILSILRCRFILGPVGHLAALSPASPPLFVVFVVAISISLFSRPIRPCR